MQKIQLMEKYPVYTIVIAKDETNYSSADAIIAYFKSLIEEHPIAKFIATFDHYEHTLNIEDHILAEDIKDAKNIIFCFGKQLPNAKVLAVRPRTIGVCEFEDKFEVSFLEVPNEQLHGVVEKWVKALKK